MRLIVLTNLLLVCMAITAQAENRWALVIGISDYKNIDPLENGSIDAQRVAEKLRSIGYKTTEASTAENTTRDEIIKLWSSFKKGIYEGDEIVIYYSGHGLDIGGANFLVPSDSPPEDEVKDRKELDLHLIPFRRFMDDLAGLDVGIQVWIIDACRQDPYSDGGKPFARTGGLSPGDGGSHKFVIYSANYGQIAADTLGEHEAGKKLGSPFTRTFLALFDEWKTQNIVDFARFLRSKVLELQLEQFPIYEDGVGKLEGWCFVECADKPPPKKALNESEISITLNAIFDSITGPADHVKNNAVYLGKRSATEYCEKKPAGGNAYPFGCAFLKRLVEDTGESDRPILLNDGKIVAGVKTNIRALLPTWLGKQPIYECVVAKLQPGESTTVSVVQPYETAQDIYYWGLVDGIPKPKCIE